MNGCPADDHIDAYIAVSVAMNCSCHRRVVQHDSMHVYIAASEVLSSPFHVFWKVQRLI